VDPVERQKQFADVNSFDYPLLSDVDGEVADRYGVRRGKIVRAISSETDMRTHADSALAALCS
jgi:peroxiredoxin Q/BCP